MRKRIVSILLAIAAFPLVASSQSYHRLQELYNYVDKTDSMAISSQRTFYLDKFLDNDGRYREKWQYTTDAGRIVYFEIDFIIDSTEFTEVYYLNKDNLICSEEYETVNYSFFEDELKKGGVFYFNGTTPQHMVMLGKAYQNQQILAPDVAVLQRFQKRFYELKRHIPMLP
jgi:hypothetical protein